VVVLFNGRPLTLEKVAASTPAILEAWFPGAQGCDLPEPGVHAVRVARQLRERHTRTRPTVSPIDQEGAPPPAAATQVGSRVR
jgi:hypothetical protein